MDNKSWRGICLSKRSDNVKPTSPIRNTFSIRGSLVKKGEDTEGVFANQFEKSNNLNEKIYELNSKISSLKERLTDINLSNIHLKNLLRQKAEDNSNKRNNRNEYLSPLPSSLISTTLENKNFKVTAWLEDKTIMAIKKGENCFGVQFHPEAILSENGILIFKNFLEI